MHTACAVLGLISTNFTHVPQGNAMAMVRYIKQIDYGPDKLNYNHGKTKHSKQRLHGLGDVLYIKCCPVLHDEINHQGNSASLMEQILSSH